MWLGDGEIGGVICSTGEDHMDQEIIRAAPGGSKLKAGKGTNFSDTGLSIRSLTGQDRKDLLEELAALDARYVDVSPTTETVGGFEQPPVLGRALRSRASALRRPAASPHTQLRHAGRVRAREPAVGCGIVVARLRRNPPDTTHVLRGVIVDGPEPSEQGL